jgi:energy-coupling factor transporter ATP-binding protein EcfA2
MPAISIENLTYYYPGSSLPALKNVNLKIRKGEFTLICGPSGGGKSTLCRCMLGLIPHFYGGKIEGKVNILGFDTREFHPFEIARKVGMVFQNPEDQLVAATVEGDIVFGLENLGLLRGEIKRRVEEALKLLDIGELRDRSPSELSSGQQQKAVIASILAMEPEVLILDEPTSELDPKSAVEILEFLNRLNVERDVTIILTEHRLENAAPYSDRILVVGDGRILHDGSPREILQIEGISEIGVNVPKIVRLGIQLRRGGVELNPLPLTAEEMASAIKEMLK